MLNSSFFNLAEERSWWRLQFENINVRPLELIDLFTSCYMGHLQILNEILRNPNSFNIFDVDCYGQSALHYAAAGNDSNILQLLIDRRLNIEQETYMTLTPLYYAVISSLDNTKLLLENGARINHNIEMLLINSSIKCAGTISLILLYYVKQCGADYSSDAGKCIKYMYAKELEVIDWLKRSYVNVQMVQQQQINLFEFLFIPEKDITFNIKMIPNCNHNQYYTKLLIEKCMLVEHAQNMNLITEMLKNL